MKGSDVFHLLYDVKYFGGVLASNQLSRMKPGKCYVINTKPSKHDGEHWVVIDRTTKRNYFFDSFGNPPEFYRFPTMCYSPHHLQAPKSSVCGIYCCYYIVNRSYGYSLKRILQPFGKNKNKNDKYVMDWLVKWSTQ